ncbi:TOBE domain-containing protein [Calderihabitans maritimus]|uniref:ABC transporter ATP-binding protein n=1 Tax=Calderihabitans maritimus TaxID=1246530 RepID=A0A1Z5HN55_9FIRM|nr:TOBE domain-containing protein [Calderihabitans maritimus]GAW90944.1 ABC transporter ATP-binding protein [Calderihabitans maritimus]
MTLKGENFSFKLPKNVEKRFAKKKSGERLTLGIRPEDVVVGKGESDLIRGEIYVVEPLGRDKLVDVKLGGNRIKLIASRDFQGNAGENVGVSLNVANIHLFDKESGKSLRID